MFVVSRVEEDTGAGNPRAVTRLERRSRRPTFFRRSGPPKAGDRSNADEGIVMGQQPSAVPGIGDLTALALGAAGVRGRRQRVVA